MNRDKHIWEGWTVGDFIDDVEVIFNYCSKHSNFWESKKDLKNWVKDNQPYYKNIYQKFIIIFYKNQDYEQTYMETIQ